METRIRNVKTHTGKAEIVIVKPATSRVNVAQATSKMEISIVKGA